MNIKQFLVGWFWKPKKGKKVVKYNEKEIISIIRSRSYGYITSCRLFMFFFYNFK